MEDDEALDLILSTFEGSAVLPPIVQRTPVVGCAHCGVMCASWIKADEPFHLYRTYGEHHPLGAGAHVVATFELTPVHPRCLFDWVIRQQKVEQREPDQLPGPWGRRARS